MVNPNERTICCCGAEGWTILIGWFQIVVTLILLFVLPVKVSAGDNVLQIFVMVFIVVVLLLRIVMAILLLTATCNRNPNYIKAWMIYNCVALILGFLAGVIKCFKAESGEQVAMYLLDILLTFVINGFFLWVVWVYRKEVQATVRYPVRV